MSQIILDLLPFEQANVAIYELFCNSLIKLEQNQDIDQLESLFKEWPEDRKLFYCDENIHHQQEIIDTLLSLKDCKYKWAVLVGPEGGFSKSEQELITKQKNVIPVSLGDRPIRSDTAITVSLFCINRLLNK